MKDRCNIQQHLLMQCSCSQYHVVWLHPIAAATQQNPNTCLITHKYATFAQTHAQTEPVEYGQQVSNDSLIPHSWDLGDETSL
jgi:hypothetical protein